MGARLYNENPLSWRHRKRHDGTELPLTGHHDAHGDRLLVGAATLALGAATRPAEP
jgi:hypothetical protein